MPERLHDNTSSTDHMRHRIGWKQVLDVLWSDPQSTPGCEPNVFRGGGCYFGPDVTHKLLRINDLDLLIRSHECKAEGYEYTHDDKCLTIFSASNYYGPGSNRGAYVVLQGAELRPHFVQFNAQTKAKYIPMRQRVGALEASALNELRKKILASKAALMDEFSRRDPAETGLIAVHEWVAVMEDHCSPGIPWRVLREKIVPLDSRSSKIVYADTFVGSVSPTKSEDSPSVVESLYRNRERLETIFRILDKDHSGFLSLDEFADACSLLQNYLHQPIPYDEMVNMAKSMDINKDGFIDFNEFLETFRLVNVDGGGAGGEPR
ncbi:serine/threonine-protein phosphatase with EF-hands 2-like [Pollicipes pollicipes]|nr:serine/threonine-protein phosphatase with EF-hands 2-like [Pollicipes pollicipes]